MNTIRMQAERFYNAHGREGAKAHALSLMQNIEAHASIWYEEIADWIDYFADMAEGKR